MKAPENIVRDLTNKAGDGTEQVVKRAAQFLTDPMDLFQISLGAAAPALGLAAGFLELGTAKGATPDELVDALWQILRPMTLKAAGGSGAPFAALLARVSPAPSPMETPRGS